MRSIPRDTRFTGSASRAGVADDFRHRHRPSSGRLFRDPQLLTALSGRWIEAKTLRPDFIFFTRQPDGSIAASIVHPHGHHLADALPKLRGLAAYAEAHGDQFQRIDAVAKVDGSLRVLDLTEAPVRTAVADATDATALYRGDKATDY